MVRGLRVATSYSGDIAKAEATTAAVRQADPDLVLHLADKSHMHRSVAGPEAFSSSKVNGTFHLLQAVHSYWEALQELRPTPPSAPTPSAKRQAKPGITPMDAGGTHQLQQQLLALAEPGETDPSGNPRGGGERANSALSR